MSVHPAIRPTHHPDRLPRGLTRRVEAAHGEGVVAAARVQAAAFVTHTALTFTEQLTAEEARAIERNPLGEARYRALVDSFAGMACNEIASLGWS